MEQTCLKVKSEKKAVLQTECRSLLTFIPCQLQRCERQHLCLGVLGSLAEGTLSAPSSSSELLGAARRTVPCLQPPGTLLG